MLTCRRRASRKLSDIAVIEPFSSHRTAEDRRRSSRANCADRSAIAWDYSHDEIIADLIVHAVGLCFGLVAATVLLKHALDDCTPAEMASVSVYVAALVSMLALSAAYNLWPVCSTKWLLRRFDHSAIYLLIASTYTPIVAESRANFIALSMLVGSGARRRPELRSSLRCQDASTVARSRSIC
jgi:predicted membrane channel-forming protein YqfA (hemolysin III family)